MCSVGRVEAIYVKTDSTILWSAKASRIRSRGQWALAIGIIGLLGCVVGTVQFWIYGLVSIRPGHDPVFGDTAVEMLLFLFMVSAVFTVYGLVMLHRTRRILER